MAPCADAMCLRAKPRRADERHHNVVGGNAERYRRSRPKAALHHIRTQAVKQPFAASGRLRGTFPFLGSLWASRISPPQLRPLGQGR
jgi:hypothetical protein